MSTLQKGVADPSTKFSVSLDGLSGSSTYAQVMGAAQRGASGAGGDTDWEIAGGRQRQGDGVAGAWIDRQREHAASGGADREVPQRLRAVYNEHGQPIGLNGKPGPRSDTHIPRNPDGTTTSQRGGDGGDRHSRTSS